MVKNNLLDSERNKKIYKMYTTTNMTALEIATEFGLTESSVRRIIRNLKNPGAKKSNQKAGSQTKTSRKEQQNLDFINSSMKDRDPITGEIIESQNDSSTIENKRKSYQTDRNQHHIDRNAFRESLAMAREQLNETKLIK